MGGRARAYKFALKLRRTFEMVISSSDGKSKFNLCDRTPKPSLSKANPNHSTPNCARLIRIPLATRARSCITIYSFAKGRKNTSGVVLSQRNSIKFPVQNIAIQSEMGAGVLVVARVLPQ